MTKMKPNLIKIADGKWVNPAFITSIEDSRYEQGGIWNGSLIIGTAGGCSLYIYVTSPEENEIANNVIRTLAGL